jgi:DNA replication protein DnaD
VAHENARGAKWGRLNTDIGELMGDEMTEEQDKLLKLVRLSMVARSFDTQMIEAMIKNDVLRVEVVRAAQQIAVEAERVRLGLTQAEALKP